MLTAQDVLETTYQKMRNDPSKLCAYETDGDVSYSNSEFLALIGRCTNYLREKGIVKKDVIALYIGRSALHFALRYACMNIGALFISIDPAIPEHRADMMIGASKAKLVLRDTFSLPDGLSPDFTLDKLTDNEPAFIVFTSGSTGTPKGIVHARGIVSHLTELGEGFMPFEEMHSSGTVSSVSFMMSPLDMFRSFYRGYTFYIFDESIKKDIPRMRSFLDKVHIDYFMFVPSYYEALGRPESIKNVSLSGEKIGEQPRREGIRLFSGYGMSEGLFSINEITNCSKDAPLGITAPGSSLTLEDEDGNPVEVGEIVYRGRGLMLGYLDDMVDGYPDRPLQEIRTGDIGKMKEDGIHILGRAGGMVKINGQRVEPAESRYAISMIDGIKDAAVTVFRRPNGKPYLCGYYTGSIEPEQLRSELNDRIDRYLIPQYLIRMEALPRNANGKVDVKVLKPPMEAMERAEYSKPETEDQRLLCDLFSRIVDVERVGLDDDFIALGGDSLAAIRISGEFSERTSKSLRPYMILSLRTPRRICESVQPLSTDLAGLSYETGCPPNNSQAMLFPVFKFAHASISISFMLSSDKWTDAQKLRSAVEETIRSHPILRMRFTFNGQPWCMFDNKIEVPVAEGDPSAIAEDFSKPFNIDTDPPCRFTVVSWKGRAYLLVDILHMVFDGRSIRPFVKSIDDAYDGKEIPVDYGPLRQAAIDGAFMKSPEFQPALGRTFARLEGADLGDTMPESQGDGDRTVTRPIHVVQIDVNAVASKLGTTAGAAMCALFCYTLRRISGRDQMIQFAEDGRWGQNLDDSVGLFAKLMPLSIKGAPEDIEQYVSTGVGCIQDVLKDVDVPLWMVGQKIRLYPHVVFQFTHYDGTVPGVTISKIPSGSTSNLNLQFRVTPSDGYYVAEVAHSKRYSDEFVIDLISEYEKDLKALAKKVLDD